MNGSVKPKLTWRTSSKIPSRVPRSRSRNASSASSTSSMLLNDLSARLPAEIDARRKQYEYYRDRLLTFEELAA